MKDRILTLLIAIFIVAGWTAVASAQDATHKDAKSKEPATKVEQKAAAKEERKAPASKAPAKEEMKAPAAKAPAASHEMKEHKDAKHAKKGAMKKSAMPAEKKEAPAPEKKAETPPPKP